MANKRPYHANARFIELGSAGAPFRSLVNVDHITNIRFEQKITDVPAQFDDDGNMTAPPQQYLEGWTIVLVLGHGAGGQNIVFPTEEQAVEVYNTMLDMIVGTGVPIARMPKLTVSPPPPEQSELLGPDGEPLLGEIPDLTEEELAQLENPEIDVDAIADAIEDGFGTEPVDDKQ